MCPLLPILGVGEIIVAIAFGCLWLPLMVAAGQDPGASCNAAPPRGLAIPADLQSRDPTDIAQLCFSTGTATTPNAVIAYGYDGPADGLIFLTWNGQLVQQPLRTGRPVSLGIRTLSSGKVILVLDVKKGSGTGFREDDLELYQLSAAGIRFLWSGISYRRQAPGIGSNPRIEIETGAISIIERKDGNAVEIVRYESTESMLAAGDEKPKPHNVRASPSRRALVDLN